MTELHTGPYPTAIKEYPVVRQSDLSVFDDCHLQALWTMERRAVGWHSHRQAAGTLLHRYVAEVLRTMKEYGQNSIPVTEAVEILREVATQRNVPDEDVVAVPLRERKDLLWVAMKFAKDNAFDIANVVHIEQRLEATVTYDTPDGKQERVLSGQPDAVLAEGKNGAIVLDWKDTWKLPPDKHPDANDPKGLSYEGYFQQRFYAWLVMMNFPNVEYVTLREFYVRRSIPREATVRRERLHHIQDELTNLVEVFDRAVDGGTESKIWTPSPGKHCRWCPRPAKCPIPEEERGEGAISSTAMATRYAAQRKVAQTVVEHRTGALQAWTEVHGPVPLKDSKGRRAVGYRSSTRNGKPSTLFGEFTPDSSDRALHDDKPLEEALRASAARAKAVKKKTRRKRINAK